MSINLPKELEKELNHLKETTKKPKSFHVKEALIRYLEDLEDIRDVKEYVKSKDKDTKYYTSEEASKRLKELSGKQK
jgi:RHH-type transcriptional regulator, rel operon repressor / antitoxin RelB